MPSNPVRVYEFGPFRLEPAERQLRREGRPVPLTPKAFDTLHVLVASGGRALSKDELMENLWPDTSVAEATLAQNIFAVRKALGEAHCIETVPKFGYRFVAPVREVHAPAGRIALAVLPFENLSGDERQEFFSDGLTEEMIMQLSRLSADRVSVIARTSTMHYKGTRKTIGEIGRELGVSYVLEGSVRRSGARVRISAQLIRTADQIHIWAESYERSLDDVLGLQCDVARAIAHEIRVTLTPQEEARLMRARAVNPDAYEAYLKGRYFWNKRTKASLEKSLEYFQQATLADAAYAAAHAGLADCYLRLLDYSYLPPQKACGLATVSALRALEIDETLAEAHTSLGHRAIHEFDWVGAETSFRRALALNAGYGTAHYYYANFLAAVGRFPEAVAEARWALALDPVAISVILNAAFIDHLAGRPDDARVLLEKALEIDSKFVHAHHYSGLIYERQRRYEQAIGAFRKALGRGTGTRAALGHACGLAGRRPEALALLQELRDRSKTEYVSPYDLALVMIGLGDIDQAFASLDKAYIERAGGLVFLKSDPRLNPLHDDPRFQTLVRCLNFP
jgi:TolB-like protein/tetratricopeptide (TPR) repeat protein